MMGWLVASLLTVALIALWVYHWRTVRKLIESQPTRRPVVASQRQGPRSHAELVRYVVGLVSEAYDVESDQIFSKRRSKKVAEARQAAIYIVHHCSKMSLADIGRRFDRHHTTVMHAIAVAEGFDLEDIVVAVRQEFPGVGKT